MLNIILYSSPDIFLLDIEPATFPSEGDAMYGILEEKNKPQKPSIPGLGIDPQSG